MGDRVVQDLLAEVERAKQLAGEERRKAGIALDGEDEGEGDYMGVVPLIEKLEKMKVKDSDSINRFFLSLSYEMQKVKYISIIELLLFGYGSCFMVAHFCCFFNRNT
ncbi:unnamed protein product [Musa textilis]